MSPIALSETGGPLDPRGPLFARALAGQALGRLPPTVLLLLALVSVQLSSALATFLFSSIGPAGTAFLSAGFAGIVLTVISPPRIGRPPREALLVVVLFGLADAGMVLPFFLALERIPLGIASAIAFLGPLSLAVATSRRLSHFLSIGVAALGIALLTPEIGLDLDSVGMGLAAVTGLAWAAFVPLSKWAGRLLPGHDGLTLGLWVASLVLLPFALAEGSLGNAGGFNLAGALLVALLNVVLPMVLEFRALQRMSARTYGVLTTLEPAIGALLGAVLLGQEIGLRTTAAVACVTLAALGITLSDRDAAR